MKCLRAEQQLALFVGGDLPESETAELTAHLESCRACANELERLKRAQELLGELARSDQPDPLPADFSGQVLAEIQKRRLDKPPFISLFAIRIRWKPALALSGAVLVILLAIGVTRDLRQSRRGLFANRTLKTRQSLTVVNPGEVLWSAKFHFIRNLIGPARLTEVTIPDEPGIYAILHKPDPVNRPKIFAVTFIGEKSELSSLSESLLKPGPGNRLFTRAGSPDSAYIVLYLLPESTEEQRRQIKESLIARYEPDLTHNGGI